MADKSTNRNFPPIRALKRGLTVLQTLSQAKDATAQQIATRLQLPRPTVVRILETLEEMGFVERSTSDGTWRLMLYVRSLSDGYNDEAWVRECAAPEIAKLGKEILWPVDLHTCQGDKMIVRESTHRTSPFSIMHGMVGTQLSMLHTSSGRAFLAFCPESERCEILARLAQDKDSGYDQAQVHQMLTQTRRQGYGLRCGELIKATNSFSVPVYARERVQAVVTVVWFVSALPVNEGVRKFLPLALKCAETISQKCQAYPDLNAL